MTLPPGSRIGPYEVVGAIGAGGMGEVYRARDTKLARLVALKVLPDLFAGDPERLARFEREARTLASLNHPHIAQLYGVEDSGGRHALAMELVEGEDLAQRIARGPIPVDDALAMARQIADALGSAHEHGIIHRDLKPANIKVRDDGTVKVLDFGLAKALESGPGTGEDARADLSKSPTITSPAMTERGVILGTAAYMSPEQAKGRVVDKRADIWAFGCVLYEMLTGRRAFAGEDVSDTCALVLKGDVDWAGVPPHTIKLIRKCLQKDLRQRLHDIGDAWDLTEAPARPDAAGVAPTRTAWPAWIAAAVLLATTVGLAVVHFTEAPAATPVVRFQLSPPPKTFFDIYLSLSPDGRRLAFTARDETGISLWVRDLDTLQSRRLPGTEGAWSPFWSPDGRYLAFTIDRVLKRIDVSGSGSPEAIFESDNIVGMGAWNADGVILFGGRGTGALRRTPAGGGVPTPVTRLDQARGEAFHSFPFFLPDGKQFLYFRQSSNPDLQGIYAGSLDVPPEQQSLTRLAATNLGPIYASSETDGRLLYLSNGVLVAQPFDARRLVLSGEPVRLAEPIGASGSFGAFSVSQTGVLAYRTGPATAASSNQLTWFDRRGQRIGKVGEPRPYASSQPNSLTLSPDGTQAVMAMISPSPASDLWLVEIARDIFTRFTFHDAADGFPVWSPDARRIVFRSSRTGGGDLYVKDANGASDDTPLLESTNEGETPTAWSHDGRLLLLHVSPVGQALDVWALALATKTRTALLRTQFSEAEARFSPDDRWISYTSNESGRAEVYVRPVTVAADGTPSVGAKWQVSNDGGTQARWRRDGRELFYRRPSGSLVAVDVSVDARGIRTGTPRVLFELGLDTPNWDVTADGQRFLVAVPIASQSAEPISMVLNWPAGLRR